jgi:transposase
LIVQLAAAGKGVKTIAHELGIDPKTVRQQLRPTRRERKRRPSQLDAFRGLIRKLVLEDELTAVRVLEEIEALGYSGGYTILTDYIRSFRPRPVARPHLRFETGPGVQGQVDLSPYTVSIAEEMVDVVCFSFVLAFSRWQFIRFVRQADVHAVCHSHALAFEACGGVPHEILYDRMKQVVIHSEQHRVIFHDLFAALAGHYGFRAVPLAPGYKEGKGKVENPFGYVEGNLLLGRHFHDWADFEAKTRWWLSERAWVRVHRSTGERPLDRLEQERPYLIGLPARRFEAAIVVPRLVGDDFCVAWETNRYSVPPCYTGKTAWARVLEGELQVVLDGEVIARHQLRSTRGKRYVAPEHEAEFRQHSTSRHVLREQFLRLGSAAEAFARGLEQERRGAAGYHMQQILKLAEHYGVARIAAALAHAERYAAYTYQALERIVKGKAPRPGARLQPHAVSPTNLGSYLKGAGRHQRSPEHYRQLAATRSRKGSGTESDDDGQ